MTATTDYVTPRLRSKFSHAGPAAWNRLAENVRRQPTTTGRITEASENVFIYRDFITVSNTVMSLLHTCKWAPSLNDDDDDDDDDNDEYDLALFYSLRNEPGLSSNKLELVLW